MGQTLDNGIYLPSKGERNCYDGLASNWTTLDSVVGGYRAHVANENIHITSEERSKWDTGVTQAYVLRYASVSLTALGTVAFSALDNTDNVKIGDKVLDSEGKLFALTAVDTENNAATLSALLIDLSKDSDLSNYYTKPETDTLLNDKADDLDVLHKTGDESKTGNLTVTKLNTTKINNLNPGSLSMPDLTAGVDISGYITAGNSHNEYTPTVDGWISVTIKKTTTSGALALFIYQGGICNSYFGNTSLPNESEFAGMASIPVKAGIVVNIDTKGPNTYIYSAKFYPCTGNV